MKQIAGWIASGLEQRTDPAALKKIRAEVFELCERFPLYPERRRAHLEAVGLDDAHLAEDLRTIGATTACIPESGLPSMPAIVSARLASLLSSA